MDHLYDASVFCAVLQVNTSNSTDKSCWFPLLSGSPRTTSISTVREKASNASNFEMSDTGTVVGGCRCVQNGWR